ncbi:MAG TPA: FAD/NAD(P)-binding oxidoreductase, partial [Rubrivivax sp.]|nr:FAD/NAD(P)-binding oxidoreductase [Rubrivivax sp.]
MSSVTRGISRRRLLAGGSALGGLAALSLAGCAGGPSGTSGASGTSSASIGRVVVIGGGFGGATAARYLRLWGGNVDVTLIERNPDFVSCPISNLVIGGFKTIGDVTRSYDGLRAAGVQIVQGDVVAIDAGARKVRLAGGTEYGYDRLVLSPGIDFMWEQVGGLQAAVDSGAIVHSWKAGAQTLALRRQIEAMPDGGVFALSIPKAPYRCPPGPYERACVVAAYLAQSKPRSKVLVLDANPEITSKKGLFEKAFKEHYAGILEYRPNAELKEVGRQ